MLTFTARAWTVVYFSERVQQQIYNLPEDILGDYLRLLDLLVLHGVDLRMAHSKALGDKLFELRPSGEVGIGRVFYCTLKGKKVVMLHSFVKKTEQTPLKELRIARKRSKEIQKNG